MLTDTVVVGKAACLKGRPSHNSEICADYRLYWSVPSSADDFTPEEIDSSSELILSRNREAARVMGLDRKKMLIISTGETFRIKGNRSRDTGSDEAVPDQEAASLSQVAFARYAKYAFGIDTDFIVNTYYTKVDAEKREMQLEGYYPKGTDFMFRKMENGIPSKIIFTAGIDRATPILEEYAAVFFIRPDLILKPGFVSYFRPFEKLTFSFYANTVNFERVLLGDALLYTPENRFTDVTAPGFRLDECMTVEDIGFMVNTFHITDTSKTSNPLFFLAGRERSDKSITDDITLDDFIGDLPFGAPDTRLTAVIFKTKRTMVDAVKKTEALLSWSPEDYIAEKASYLANQASGSDSLASVEEFAQRVANLVDSRRLISQLRRSHWQAV